MRAAVYARYSSDHQRAPSIDDQLRLCREFVERQNWTLTQVYKDAALSGASALRPGYQAILEDARRAEFDIIVVEALDRLSRDQEDIAGFFKRCQHAGVRIHTLSEGQVSELHVGLKGTMNALFLRDLADKTRRGLRGRVEAGSSGGGLTYGYDVVASLERRGGRTVNAAQAAVVRRIFADYRDGLSPKRIAVALNQEGIAGPRGGAWAATTINGNRDRGTGILNNELYVGRLVWNRLRYSKDPETGRRQSRPNDPAAIVTTDVPELRIIDDELCEAVRARQGRLSHREKQSPDTADPPSAPFWSKQRPKHLFSRLTRCGTCGGGFSMISKSHLGCSTARNKGETACANRLTIRRDVLESTVLDGLRARLMDPALYQAFAAEFTAEWNRMQAHAAGDLGERTKELARVKDKLERLVDAICNGTPALAVKVRMRELEELRIALEHELATAIAPAPRLHPNLAILYRQRVAALADALTGDGAAAARDLLRGLIDEIRIVPEGRTQRVELRGELAAILGLSGATNTKAPAGVAGAVCMAEQVKVVAGTGFEPVAFRL